VNQISRKSVHYIAIFAFKYIDNMTTVFVTIAFVAIFFGLMSVRLIFLKKGEFKGTCASQNPYLNKSGEPCGYCGKPFEPGNSCADEENEVDKVLSKFA
jgi:hypothetical protein